MKVAFAQPAKDEVHLIGKNDARRIVRSLFPEVELLAFQTMHGPKMCAELPYLATFTWKYIRILSIRRDFAVDDLKAQFQAVVLPHICKSAKQQRESSVLWPRVIVAVGDEIHEVRCSEGWMFPSFSEVMSRVKKQSQPICRFQIDTLASRVSRHGS